jgi:hypothetical protein
MSEQTDKPQGPSQPFACKRCGVTVWWDTSKKTGGRYLACTKRVGGIGAGGGSWSKGIKIPHRCDPTTIANYEAEVAYAEQQRLSELASGKIMKGQRVVVARGRKVPKGTRGIVFWIGDNGWGESVGIEVEGTGERVFTASTNCDAQPMEVAK